jgi:hypothetical protein
MQHERKLFVGVNSFDLKKVLHSFDGFVMFGSSDKERKTIWPMTPHPLDTYKCGIAQN